MANKKVINEIVEDDVIEEVPVEDEVSEEVVQAVANAIVEQADEDNKSVEEIVDEIVEESKDDVDKLAEGRGFKSYKDAVEYASSEAFGRLHPFDQEEFNNWLKEIK